MGKSGKTTQLAKECKIPALSLQKKKVLKWRPSGAWIHGEIGGYRSVCGCDFFLPQPNSEQNSLAGWARKSGVSARFFGFAYSLLLGHFGGLKSHMRRIGNGSALSGGFADGKKEFQSISSKRRLWWKHLPISLTFSILKKGGEFAGCVSRKKRCQKPAGSENETTSKNNLLATTERSNPSATVQPFSCEVLPFCARILARVSLLIHRR